MSKKINIAYHMPSLNTIYAQRTIYNGFKNAFLDLGYGFSTFTSDKKLEKFLEDKEIDIFITCSHYYYQKYLDYSVLKRYRERGLKLFTKIDFWNSPIKKWRINEQKSLKDDIKTVKKIKEGSLGDIFFHVVEQGDCRMEGFEEETGYKYYTIPLAADKTLLNTESIKELFLDVVFIGTNLPQKKQYFNEYLLPLRNKYKLGMYGQDWNKSELIIGYVQRFGQYFNIPYLRSIRKPRLKIEDELRLYSSSIISINLHEDFQRKYGGDCNERTFKIPLYGGFEITDDVACIRKYFKEDKEIVIAKDRNDWFDKIDYYIKNPDKRFSIMKAGRKRVLKDHTYHSRVEQIINIYRSWPLFLEKNHNF